MLEKDADDFSVIVDSSPLLWANVEVGKIRWTLIFNQ